DLISNKIDLYHGLSNEIPIGIEKTGVRSVVTIHDLIFERNPTQYNRIDVLIYRQKFRHACKKADHIIAISNQTRVDITSFYKIPENRISVCYQSCDPSFSVTVSAEEKNKIRQMYNLPQQFFLYVGSIIERKNLLNICKALSTLNGKAGMPLVVIGEGNGYKKRVKEFIQKNRLDRQIIFLSENENAQRSDSFRSGIDFPAIYQLAHALVYPSIFEGFGIPVLEALWSRTPVITSNLSCLPEVGGDAAYYVDPFSSEEIASAMLAVANDEKLADDMKQKGWMQAQNFTPQKCAAQVMEVYLRTK
ncbi:MAG TPA: glycosyltransferase family 1 protein, partial [Segetibacter sp.]|nr:glycosyltransferase family 1 protein [Segetibacter sp.]